MKAIRTGMKYIALSIVLALTACALQYLAGLAPQQSVRAHLIESMPQLIGEGLAPGVLYDGHPRSKLDNLSENYILTYSYYMDTRTDADAVLSNPGRQIQDPYDELFLQTETLLSQELPADTNYVRYWLGFRMYVRPMLAVMNYMDARQCIQWGFFILLGLVTIVLYRQTKSLLLALAFPAAMSQLNPLVVASCFQYSACFYIAFIGMLLVPTVQKRRFTMPMLFFTIGFCTQVFDFYTAPVLTCGLPLVMLLLLPETDALTPRVRWKRFFQCIFVWILGYVGAWLMKMTLTTLFTPYNGLYDGLSRLLFWMQPAQSGSNTEKWLALKAVYWCMINIVDLLPLILEGLLLLLYAATVFKTHPGKGIWTKNLPLLVACALPILWFMAAAKPSYEQFYFQYRGLGILLFAGLAFLIRTAGWDKLFPEREIR